ncbi:hypothetical protein BJX65DRAFT_306251 [Aspergillus insuetus]
MGVDLTKECPQKTATKGGRSLVSLGTIVLVLMLAFDPFAQQILNYRSIVRAVEKESGGAAVRQSRYGPLFLQVDDREVPAYHRGLWTNDFDVQPLCPSGNCTWPTVQSLGFCSTCTDMTSEATFICEQGTEDGLLKPCRAEIPGDGTSNTTTRFRGLELSSVYEFIHRKMPFGRSPAGNLARGVVRFRLRGSVLTTPALAHEGVMLKNVTTCSISLWLRNYSVSMTDAVLSTTTLAVDRGQVFDRDEYQGHCSPTDIVVQQALFPGNNYNSIVAVNASEFTICSLRRFLVEPLVCNNSVTQDYNTQSGREPWWTSRGPTRELSGPDFDRIANLGFETAMSNISAALTQSSLEQSNFSKYNGYG